MVGADQLVSGDRVKLPRKGWRTIVRMTGKSRTTVTFLLDDGRTKTFFLHEQIEAETATVKPSPQPGEILRFDLETGRTSLVSPDLFGFHTEIHSSFQPFGRTASMADSAALAELRRGATLYTSRAIYSAA